MPYFMWFVSNIKLISLYEKLGSHSVDYNVSVFWDVTPRSLV
jgi:hypothetical protein